MSYKYDVTRQKLSVSTQKYLLCLIYGHKYYQFFSRFVFSDSIYQLTFTCSKSTIETLERGVKYIQS